MKHNILPGGADRVIHHLRKIGKTGVALLLAVTMILGALPYGGAYSAYAESGASDVSSDVSADPQIDGAVEESQTTTTTNTTTVTTSSAEESTATTTVAATTSSEMSTISSEAQTTATATTTTTAANINAVFPLVSGSDSVSNTDTQQPAETTSTTVPNINVVLPLVSSSDVISGSDISNSDVEKHVCVIHGFEGYIPGVALTVISLESVPENGAEALLPRTLIGIMGCEECSDVVNVEWVKEGSSENGADVYRVKLDEESYSYIVLDDPKTKDIDESDTSPYCDLPYVEIIVKTVSDSDVTVDAETVTDSDVVSETDAALTPMVSQSDVASGSDVVSDSEVVPGQSNASEDRVGTGEVSSSDINSESQILPLCVCHSHCYADLENGQYIVDINCAVCSADPSACLVTPDMPERALEATAEDGRLVTVVGPLPEGASLSVVPVPHDEARQMLGGIAQQEEPTICFAYDIKIIYEGQSFQPGDYGNNVTVNIHSVGTVQAESLEVYHITEGEPERMEVQIEESFTASFETDGFSVFVGTTEYGNPNSTEIYVWRTGTNANEDAGHYFSLSAADDGNTANALRMASNGEFFHRIQDVVNAYCPEGGSLTIYTIDTYCTNGTEHIDGTGKNITIKQYAGHDRNVINVRKGSLTMTNVLVDAKTTTTKDESYDATVLVDADASFVMNDGARLVDGTNHGVMLNGTGAKFTMNGGEISGHSAPNLSDDADTIDANGAGVFVSAGATFTMNGGTICNNTAEHSGGGVWNDGTMYMYGGSIIGNKATSNFGGGIICHGNSQTRICGGVISGNDSVANNTGDGICVHQTADNKPHLLMTGDPLITDIVALGFDGNKIANKDISVYGDFTPRSIINIALRYDAAISDLTGKEVVSTLKDYSLEGVYTTREATSEDIAKFALIDPQFYLYIDSAANYQLRLGRTTGVAYFERGATGSGKTPTEPTGDMVAAYKLLASGGGTIYVLKDYQPDKDVTLSGSGITYNGTTTSVTGGYVTIKRYSTQKGYSSVASNTAYSLITANEGVTVTLSDITIDGHNRPVEKAENSNYTASALTSVNNPSLHVNGGTMNLTGYTRIKDTPVVTKANTVGGAVYIWESGVLNISGNVTFDNNISDNIYVDSDECTVNLGGNVTLGDKGIHLATAAAKVTINDGCVFRDETGADVLDITLSDDASKIGGPGRIVATYPAGNPDLDQVTVSNTTAGAFDIEIRGNNIILHAEDEVTLTAAPVDAVLGDGKVESFTVRLSDLFPSAVLSASTSVSLSAVPTGISLVDYTEVDSNAATWGTADAKTKFGLEANGTIDLSSATSMSYTSNDEEITFTLHNANAIIETQEVGTIALTISVGGYSRIYTITVNTQGGTVCVTVPLKITGTVDAMGEFTLPSAEAYKITNKSTFPVELTNIEWTWKDGAAELFSDVDAMSAAVLLGDSAGEYVFSSSSSTSAIADGQINAQSAMGLGWDIVLGSGNHIKKTSTEHVATITYTIGVVE